MEYVIPDRFIRLPRHRDDVDFDAESEMFRGVLDSAEKENDVQRYIKDNQKWFIPGSLLRNYDFGHHEAYIVPEQALGAEYKADYMLLGKNSIGYQIVLVEFEDVNVDYKLKNFNTESDPVRKGITQIMDWKRWLDEHRSYFIQSSGLESISGIIPSWGIYYSLVVGRRSRMDEIANQMRGQKMRETPGLSIVSYDRLVDNIKMLINGY